MESRQKVNMKDKMIAVTILLMVCVILPVSAAAPKRKNQKPSKVGSGQREITPVATATPNWDISKPSSCSVEGPPPCEKCSVTCNAGHPPICTPGDSSGNLRESLHLRLQVTADLLGGDCTTKRITSVGPLGRRPSVSIASERAARRVAVHGKRAAKRIEVSVFAIS